MMKEARAGWHVGIDYGTGQPNSTFTIFKDGKVVSQGEVPSVYMHGNWLLVLLDPDPVDKFTAGGLLVPQTATDNIMRTGTIVRVGPGKWADKPVKKGSTEYRRMPLGVEVGERVLFVKFAVTHTETSKRIQQIVGKDFGFIQPSDILLAGEDVDKVTG